MIKQIYKNSIKPHGDRTGFFRDKVEKNAFKVLSLDKKKENITMILQ